MSRLFERTITLLIAAAMVPATLHAGTRQNDTELLKAREAVWRAFFAGDLEQLKQLVPPDTIVISAGDREWKNRTDVLNASTQFHASGAKLTRLEFPQTRIQHFGEVAIIWSEYVVETESGGKRSVSSGRATEVFVLKNGRWLNPGWHTDAEK